MVKTNMRGSHIGIWSRERVEKNDDRKCRIIQIEGVTDNTFIVEYVSTATEESIKKSDYSKAVVRFFEVGREF